jgi:hypothetical protein
MWAIRQQIDNYQIDDYQISHSRAPCAPPSCGNEYKILIRCHMTIYR